MKKIIENCLIILLYSMLVVAMCIYPMELSYNVVAYYGVVFGILMAGMAGMFKCLKYSSNNLGIKLNKKFFIRIVIRLCQCIMMGHLTSMVLCVNVVNSNFSIVHSELLINICNLLYAGLVINSIINIVIKIIKKVKEEVNYIREAVKKD
ncbi:hypothetical protein [Clostridium sulfidigenes]|uniref:hypothetical protein n=1 Tax=Clostridium sulfidigenes TaxID=318464 RepID=UPI003F8BD7C8